MEHCIFLEAALREELKRRGDRWTKRYKSMSDVERKNYLGQIAACRLVGEAHAFWARRNEKEEAPDFVSKSRESKEILETMGPLGNNAGGGRRVIRDSNTH